jgi:hypothetical protein
MNSCPHCGDTSGYYKWTPVRGKIKSNYTFDDEYDEENNIEIHDYLNYGNEQKTKYCLNCERIIK